MKHCFDMFVNSIDVEPEFTALYSFDSQPHVSILNKTNLNISAEMLDFDREAWAEHFGHWGNDA